MYFAFERKRLGDADGGMDADAILTAERDKTWAYISELVEDTSVFDIFKYAIDFHNLKAAIKRVYTDSDIENIFNINGTLDPELMLTAIREQDYELLPAHMRAAAQEAFKVLSLTRDGQLCDMIIDKAALETIRNAGKKADDEVIPQYAEITVAAADIKIAVRASKMGKSYEFIKNALANATPST
jgi:V/A-type H+-transporting ATPase subunit C